MQINPDVDYSNNQEKNSSSLKFKGFISSFINTFQSIIKSNANEKSSENILKPKIINVVPCDIGSNKHSSNNATSLLSKSSIDNSNIKMQRIVQNSHYSDISDHSPPVNLKNGIKLSCIIQDGNIKDIILLYNNGSLSWGLSDSNKFLSVPVEKVDSIQQGLPDKLMGLGWDSHADKIFHMNMGSKSATFLCNSDCECITYIQELKKLL